MSLPFPLLLGFFYRPRSIFLKSRIARKTNKMKHLESAEGRIEMEVCGSVLFSALKIFVGIAGHRTDLDFNARLKTLL